MIRKVVLVLAAMALGMVAFSAIPSHAKTGASELKKCTRDIKVTRDVGDTIASWTMKCTHSVQVFSTWFGVEKWGAKSTGSASEVIEPSSLTLARADCAGYNTFNSAGTETNHIVTFGSGC